MATKTTAKKRAVTDRLASIGAALPAGKVTAAGVTVKKGPGGRPRKYAEGEKDRVTLVLSREDRAVMEHFTMWLSLREGKRLALAEALLFAVRDSGSFRDFTKATGTK